MSGLVPWVVLFLLSLGGGGVVLAPVAVLTRDARPAFALAWWRAALLALVALPTAEVSGLTRWAREALPSMRSPRTVVTTRTTPALAPADGLPEPVRWPALLGGAGTLALAGRWLVGKALLLRMRRRLHPLASAELAVRIDRVARQLKCPMPAVGQSSALEGPLVFAAWGSVLALPADFESSYSPAQQEAILAHELGHLAQRDPLWHDLTEGLTALVWWNPLVWWARSRLAQASESAADEATLALEDGPVLLAESLLALAHRLTARQANGAFGVTGGLRSRLATRVRRLLELRPANSPQEAGRRGRFVAAASIFAVVLGVCFVTAWCRPAGAHASLWPMIRPVTPARPPARAGGRLTNEEAIASLGMSAEQERRFWELRAELDADNAALYRSRSGHVERGLEINQKWRGGLKAIFTPAQYRAYCAYWASPGVRLAAPVRAHRPD